MIYIQAFQKLVTKPKLLQSRWKMFIAFHVKFKLPNFSNQAFLWQLRSSLKMLINWALEQSIKTYSTASMLMENFSFLSDFGAFCHRLYERLKGFIFIATNVDAWLGFSHCLCLLAWEIFWCLQFARNHFLSILILQFLSLKYFVLKFM